MKLVSLHTRVDVNLLLGCIIVHGELDSLSPERVGNSDWEVKNMDIVPASLYIVPNLRCLCGHCRPMDTARESICCKKIDKIQSLLVGDPSSTCITMHIEFPIACLSRTVLTIACKA